jgi:ATPase subunit of ABC transporter with duplicated ATPase domains
MCEPVSASTLLPLALSAASAVGGTAYNWHVANEQEKANSQANAASAAAREAERKRQAQFTEQARTNWDQTRERLTPEEHSVSRERAAQDIAARLEALGAGQQADTVSTQPRASDAVREVIARQTQTAAQKSRQQIDAAARMGAYDQTNQERGFALGDNADLLSTLANLRQGSLGVNSLEANVPARQVSPNPWVQGGLAVGQAVGQAGMQSAGFSAGFGG